MSLGRIPKEVLEGIEQLLSKTQKVTLSDFALISGGSINTGGKLTTSEGLFFVKWNSSVTYPRMFETEASGISHLHKSKAIRVPQVLGYGEGSLPVFATGIH